MKPGKLLRLAKQVTYRMMICIQVDWEAPVSFFVEWEQGEEIGALLQWRFLDGADRRRFMALDVKDQLSLYERMMDPEFLKEHLENQSYG